MFKHSYPLFIKAIIFHSLIYVVASLSGCLTYVPSRAELQDQNDDEDLSSAKVGGPEEFLAYEATLDQRLKNFLESRTGSEFEGANSGYKLGAGDVISVEVFGLPDLSSVSEIGADGTIVLTYLNPIQVGGLTPLQLQTRLKSAYRTYVKSPKIKVEVKEYASSSVSIMGAVEKPGIYPLIGKDNSLTSILSRAGGRTNKAGTRVIVLPASSNDSFSPNPDVDSGIRIDFSDLIGSIDQAPLKIPLVPGDTIIVPEMGTFKVTGEVRKPGSFPLTTRTSVLGAVAAAEGLTYSANVNEVEVIRNIGKDKRASFIVDVEKVARTGLSDVILRDSDIVRVPSEPGLFRTRQVVEFLNGFFRAGVSGQVRY